MVFQNGTYDVTTGAFYKEHFDKNDFVFTMIKADYKDYSDYDKKVQMFVKRFCNYDSERETLFYEILGIILSNIMQKKDIVLFIGIADSGKSSVLKLLEFVVGPENYKAIPVDELAKEYTLAEIRDAKVIADDDIPCDRKINSKEISLLKTISAHGKIRGRRIFQAPMDFIPKASIVWAGNAFPKFATTEDITPLLNRMIIFPLDVAVREDEKDIHILDTLINGRSYLIGRAMQALTRLVERNFQFSEVVDVRQFYNPSKENGIMDYVNLYCEFGEQFRCGSRELYDSYGGQIV